MKAIILNASPRKSWNTAGLLKSAHEKNFPKDLENAYMIGQKFSLI